MTNRSGRRRRPALLREVPLAIWLVAGIAGAVGAASGCRPVGGPVADAIVTGLFAAVAVLLGSQSTRPPLLLGALLTIVGGTDLTRALGVAAVVVVLLLERRGRFEPSAAGIVALVVVGGALHLPPIVGERGSAAFAAAAVGPMVVSGVRHAPRTLRRWMRRAAPVTGGLVLLAVAGAAIAMVQARGSAEHAQDDALAGVRLTAAGEQAGSVAAFRTAAAHFAEASTAAESWYSWPGRQLPGIGPQVRTVAQLSRSGLAAAVLAHASASRIDAQDLRLVDGRIDLAGIRTARATLADVARATHALRVAPVRRSPWLLPVVRRGVDRFERTVAKADASASVAAEAAGLAPAMLGGEGARHYFVMFVTPAEARASGGFMGNYAILTIDDGKVDLGPIGRVADLDAGGDPGRRTITRPADYVARYARFDPARTWENVTMSPDFPSVGRVVADLYPQSGGTPIDGVLRLDPVALQGLLALSGPVPVSGLTVPIDATNVVPFLLRDQYALFDDQARRIDLLGEIGRATFDRLTSGPGATPQSLGAAMGARARQGHIALWMADREEQRLVQRIGAAAGVVATDGDSFGVVTQNGSASKIDAFLQRTVSYRASIDATTGQVRATARIVLHNAAPAEGLAAYVIGNEVGLPSGTNRSYVSVYSSLSVRGALLDGRPLGVREERELGRNVTSATIDIGPGRSRTLVVELGGTIDLSGGRYRFTSVAQVQARPDRVSWEATVTHGDVRSVRPHGLAADGVARAGAVRVAGRAVAVRPPSGAGAWSVDVGVVRSR